MINKKQIIYELLIFAIFIALFLVFPNYDQGYDSYSYALDVRAGQELFHPHHLLYNILGYLIYQIFKFTGAGSLRILSLANSLIGAFTLVIFYRIARVQAKDAAAVVATFMTGFLFSFWYYATSVEVNMPALMFFCLALYAMATAKTAKSSYVWAYIFITLGVLFHQLLVLAIIPILGFDTLRQKNIWRVIRQAAPALALGLVIYIAAAAVAAPERTPGGIYRWLTLYGQLGAWGKISSANLSTAVWGLIKTFFGGDAIRRFVYSWSWTFSTTLNLLAIIIFAFGLVRLMVILLKDLIRVRRGAWLRLLFILCLIFGFFALWWAPADDGFWLYPVVLFMLVTGSFKTDKQGLSTIRKTSVIMLFILAIINLTYEILPATKIENSPTRQGVEVFRRLELNSNDLVLTSFSQIRLAYEYYYNIEVPTTCLMYLPEGDKNVVISDLHHRIDTTLTTGRVIIFEDEIYPEPYRRYLFERFSPEEYIMTYRRYLPDLVPVDSLQIYGKNVRLYSLLSSQNINSPRTLPRPDDIKNGSQVEDIKLAIKSE